MVMSKEFVVNLSILGLMFRYLYDGGQIWLMLYLCSIIVLIGSDTQSSGQWTGW